MHLLVLIVCVAALAILGHSWLTGRTLRKVDFRMWGLVPAAVIPQLLAFYVPATRVWLPDLLAPVILVWSQLVLLGFVLLNSRRPGMPFLGLGLAMNFVVILANGGMMPLTPQTASRISSIDTWAAGARFGPGKSVVVPTQTTTLGSLSDRIMLPEWFPYQAAYSLGDVFILAGALVLLWAITHGAKAVHSGKQEQSQKSQAPDSLALTDVLLHPAPDYGPQQVGG